MTPHLVKWDKELRRKGLRIIDINNGAIDTKSAVAENVKKKNKKYPTIWDKGQELCTRYGVSGYPAAFLIGVEGKVIWEGWPNPELKKVEALIREELAKVKHETKASGSSAAPRKGPPGDKRTPERKEADGSRASS